MPNTKWTDENIEDHEDAIVVVTDLDTDEDAEELPE